MIDDAVSLNLPYRPIYRSNLLTYLPTYLPSYLYTYPSICFPNFSRLCRRPAWHSNFPGLAVRWKATWTNLHLPCSVLMPGLASQFPVLALFRSPALFRRPAWHSNFPGPRHVLECNMGRASPSPSLSFPYPYLPPRLRLPEKEARLENR
jgi:hypothetical protein